jgi:hypothetical protein
MIASQIRLISGADSIVWMEEDVLIKHFSAPEDIRSIFIYA